MDDQKVPKTKKRPLPTRSFGAEPPVPDASELAGWIADHRGVAADITTYRLEQSLAPQIGAGIDIACAGGLFMADRLVESIAGLNEHCAVDELQVQPAGLIEDAAGILLQKKNAWCALPAPHMLGITDHYYNDEAEWMSAITGAYLSLMRSMRDTGTEGHVLICDAINPAELAALSRWKVFFFPRDAALRSLEYLLERQSQVAVPASHLDVLFSLAGEYEIRRLVIVDPDPAAIRFALTRLDPDQVTAGGYCTGGWDKYWKDLIDKAWT